MSTLNDFSEQRSASIFEVLTKYTKKPKEPKFLEFNCWRCETSHLFLQYRLVHKILPKHKAYDNDLWAWISIECPGGGAMLEDFDPEEELVLSKTGKRKKK